MTYPFRICQNNLAADSAATITASSSMAGFGIANVVDIQRWKTLKFSGVFNINQDNNICYINDGSDRDITLADGSYTGTALAALIQSTFNSISSDWICTYSTTTYKFTLGRSAGDAFIRLNEPTTPAWPSLGYVGGAALYNVGTGTVADEQRNHTSEKITIDFGAARTITAFHLLGAARAQFGIGSTAIVKLSGNNIPAAFDTAPLIIDLTGKVYDEGIAYYLDSEGAQTYRYWEIDINDQTNPAGPQFELNYLYLGDYVAPATRNLNVGFQRVLVDPSIVTASVAGNVFIRRKTKYWQWSGLSVEHVDGFDRTELERVFSEMGVSLPFIFSIDPTGEISANLIEMTKFMRFDADPSRDHEVWKYHNLSMSLVEWI